MPLVPCLYLLWFSYNQMENLKKQIRPACKSLCPTTVLLSFCQKALSFSKKIAYSFQYMSKKIQSHL